MPVRRDSDEWHAVWALDSDNGHREYFGARDDVIGWATARCVNVRVWSERIQDIVEVGVGGDQGDLL
jgi:hypothetical protein